VDFEPKYGSNILSRSKVFRENDVLYGRLRPNLNKVFLAEPPISEGVCSGEFYVLIPDAQKVRPRFLRAILASNYVQAFVCNWHTGSALPRLQLDDLMNVEVPVPALDVQDELVSLLKRADLERRTAKQIVRSLTTKPMSELEAALEHADLGELGQRVDEEILPPLVIPPGSFDTRRRTRNATASLL
jgi:hypothetical protein